MFCVFMFVILTVDPVIVELDVRVFTFTKLVTIDEPVNVEYVIICEVTVEIVAVETSNRVVEILLLNTVETVAVELIVR